MYVVHKTFSCVVINVGLGIIVYEAGCKESPGDGYQAIWIYIGFFLFQVVINAALYAYFSYSSSKLPSLKGLCIDHLKCRLFASEQ